MMRNGNRLSPLFPLLLLRSAYAGCVKFTHELSSLLLPNHYPSSSTHFPSSFPPLSTSFRPPLPIFSPVYPLFATLDVVGGPSVTTTIWRRFNQLALTADTFRSSRQLRLNCQHNSSTHYMQC
jgi:hypothetical protein